VLGASAVQAVATSPAAVLTTGSAAVAGIESLASSSSSSVGVDAGSLGSEFTLDAATLEQLRGAGDASGALIDTSSTATPAAAAGQ